MRVMKVDKSKCLICEDSCCQKGLAFFKFPEEESRLKMWIKEISPMLDNLKIPPDILKENGRICARHFKEKDFINSKQNSLVHNACPNLSLSNVNLNFQKEDEGTEIKNKRLTENELSNDGSEKDLFQCGKCKSEYEVLSEFLEHKKFKCKSKKKELAKDVIKKTEAPPQNNLFPAENSSTNNKNEPAEAASQESCSDSSSEEVVKIISPEPVSSDKMISLVFNDSGMVVETLTEISSFPAQIILTPQIPLYYNGLLIGNSIDLPLVGQVIISPQIAMEGAFLINNAESKMQTGKLVLTAVDSNRVVVYDYSMQNNGGVVFTSDIRANQVPNPIEHVKETDQTFNLKLTVADDTSQQTFLKVQDKGGKDEITQVEENDFEKLKMKLPCSYCGKMFEKPFNLQQHERVHTGERPFQCIVCGRAFTQKSNVRKHMMRHRVWPKGKQTLKLKKTQEAANEKPAVEIDYSCQYCTLSFKSYPEHKKHLSVHSNFKVYRCIQRSCNETFTDLDEFLSHSKMHSSAEFQCHICLKTFTNLEELGAHQYDHDITEKKKGKDTEIKLKCDVCHARFKTSESLKNHLAVDSHNYECIHCKSVFCSERFLRRHLFIHVDSSQSKFKCQNCKKIFRTQQNLKNHMFIHSKEKPFTCEHCQKQFASKYRLRRHVAIHLNQYFECPLKKHLGCDKTFYRKDKLRDHMNTHSHCRLRSSRVCSKTYWTFSKLHSQMKRDHKTAGKGRKEQLKCFGCSQIFRKQKQLNQHHCTVEGKKSKGLGRNPAGKKQDNPEAVSNIEIIMVPFGADGQGLT